MKPSISFIIQKPSPDLDNESYEGNKVYIRGAVHSLDHTVTDQLGILVPHHVFQFVRKAFENQRYRVEILDGDTLYKVYRQPPAEIWPREEEGTALEKFQIEQKVKSGAGSGNAIDQALDLVKPPDEKFYDGMNQEIISGNVLGEPVSVRCLDACDTPGDCLGKKQCKKIQLDAIPRTKQQIEFERAIKEAAESNDPPQYLSDNENLCK